MIKHPRNYWTMDELEAAEESFELTKDGKTEGR